MKKNRADLPPDEVPFDFEHLKRANYDKSDKLKKTVFEILKAYLQRLNYIQVETTTP